MKNLRILMIAAISIFAFACADYSAAKKEAKEFYEALKVKDYEKIITFLDESTLKATPKEQLIEVLKRKENWGNLKDYSQRAFKTKTENNVTMTKLNYVVEYDKKTFYEILTFKTVDKKTTLVYYHYSEDQADIEDF